MKDPRDRVMARDKGWRASSAELVMAEGVGPTAPAAGSGGGGGEKAVVKAGRDLVVGE